jgi:hypothetical protein
MLNEKHQRLDAHERFKELSALASVGALCASEYLELERHLKLCADCSEARNQYRLLSEIGLPWLASHFAHPRERKNWDDSEVRDKLLARIRTEPSPHVEPAHLPQRTTSSRRRRKSSLRALFDKEVSRT